MMWWWRTSVCSGKGGSGCNPASTSSSPPGLRPESLFSPDAASGPATSSSSCFCGGRLPLSMVPHRSSAWVRPLCLPCCGVPFSVPHLCLPLFASSLSWYAIYYIYMPSLSFLLACFVFCFCFCLVKTNGVDDPSFLPSFCLILIDPNGMWWFVKTSNSCIFPGIERFLVCFFLLVAWHSWLLCLSV